MWGGKGSLDLDWSDAEERRAVVGQLVADARVALALATRALRGCAKDAAETQALRRARQLLADLLADLLAEDIDEEPSGSSPWPTAHGLNPRSRDRFVAMASSSALVYSADARTRLTRSPPGEPDSEAWEWWVRTPPPPLAGLVAGFWAGDAAQAVARHRMLPNGEVMLAATRPTPPRPAPRATARSASTRWPRPPPRRPAACATSSCARWASRPSAWRASCASGRPWNAWPPAPAVDLSAPALECGYYDQAHLYRDLRELADMTPLDYLAGRGEAEDSPDVIGG